MDSSLAGPHASPAQRAADRFRSWLVVALVCLAGLAPRRVSADSCPAPDVWVVSTRRLPGICRVPARASFDVEQLSAAAGGRWRRASVDELLGEPGLPLVFFIHGNRYEAADAKSQGVRLARIIAGTCPDSGPVRTVIFSWPSEQRGMLFRDVREKYDRAHADGHYLGRLLAEVEPERPVAVVGFSFGAIVGLQALRDRAALDRGDGTDTAPREARPRRTHVVLVAPAVRADALAPRGPYRHALTDIDRVSLVVNSADHALRFFDYIDDAVNATALGVDGMPRRWLPAGLEFTALDAADIVGRDHSLARYLGSPRLARRIATAAVADLQAPPATAATRPPGP